MKTYLFVLLLLVVGCKAKQLPTETKENTPVSIDIKIIDESITFKLNNNTLKQVELLNPQKLLIYRYENNNWQKLKILLCPCDAPCNAPEEKFSLDAKQSYTIQWDKKESWCGDRSQHGIRETIQSPASPGKYKITFLISEDGKTKEMFKEFKL